MTQHGSVRFALSRGAMLADPDDLGNLFDLSRGGVDASGESLFDPQFWRARGALTPTAAGRGASWFIAATARNGTDEFHWVLRHYRRGGWAAHVSPDRYVFLGERAVRSFAEFRLLARLRKLGLPVPHPVAARYQRCGFTYRCDLITQRIAGGAPLSDRLANHAVPEATWRTIGGTLARLHRAGVDHADLNAHNILLDEEGLISVIDLDRSRVRGQGAWVADNLNRLRRSLQKVGRDLPSGRWTTAAWDSLLAGYREP